MKKRCITRRRAAPAAALALALALCAGCGDARGDGAAASGAGAGSAQSAAGGEAGAPSAPAPGGGAAADAGGEGAASGGEMRGNAAAGNKAKDGGGAAPRLAAAEQGDIDLAHPPAEAVKGARWDYEDGVYVIHGGADIAVTGTENAAARAEMEGPKASEITLDSAMISFTEIDDAAINLLSGARVTVRLAGTGEKADIHVMPGAVLTIASADGETAEDGVPNAGGDAPGGRRKYQLKSASARN